jgi:LysM repeat protein
MARAGIISDIIAALIPTVSAQNEAVSGSGNIATMQLQKPAMNIDPSPAVGGGGIDIIDHSALLPQEGPSGTIADIEKPKNDTISTYVVREGDTLSGIAQMFNVTPSTILWANDIPKGAALQPGQKLTILPITGIKYTVKKGDSLASIAKTTGSDALEIGSYNGVDDGSLAVGTEIIIPEGEATGPQPSNVAVAPKPKPKSLTTRIVNTIRASGNIIPMANNPREPAHDVGAVGSAAEIAYYVSPLAHYIQTQGIHGYNGVDLAAPSGTPIVASASGDVIVAKAGGWNGGYGSYVVIQHANGSQTLYAHMSKVATYDGGHVAQGQVIGYVGTTGMSTGSHVHFEIRNGIRNPF